MCLSPFFYVLDFEDSHETLKRNSPCRVSWKIYNYTAQRLELLASPVCGPNVNFQGANQKHLVLNPESSEIMKGFIFVTSTDGSKYDSSSKDVAKLPTLLLKDQVGNEIAYFSNATPEFQMGE